MAFIKPSGNTAPLLDCHRDGCVLLDMYLSKWWSRYYFAGARDGAGELGWMRLVGGGKRISNPKAWPKAARESIF